MGRRHISTSGFGATAIETAFFALFFAHTAQQSVVDGPDGLSSSKPCAYWVAAIFLFPVSPLQPPRQPFFALCILAKRYVLAKNCLKERIGNQGQRVDFLGRRDISTSGFAATATAMAVFALFLLVQPSDWY